MTTKNEEYLNKEKRRWEKVLNKRANRIGNRTDIVQEFGIDPTPLHQVTWFCPDCGTMYKFKDKFPLSLSCACGYREGCDE